MKFYKVTVPVKNWSDMDINEHRKYRKWAWETCGKTWALTPPRHSPYDYKSNDHATIFYIGFESGEDKMGFRLAHDPEPLTVIERNLKVFVREWQDK